MSAAGLAAAMVPALAVAGLSRAFGGVQAVKDVSFAVAEGELLALIGPNGAGKSTCFNMLNGQIRPDRGSVKLAGEELVGLSPPEIWRRGVGRTFQITATFPSMTVAENVAMVLMSERRELFSFTRSAVNRHRAEARRTFTARELRRRSGSATAEEAALVRRPTPSLATGSPTSSTAGR